MNRTTTILSFVLFTIASTVFADTEFEVETFRRDLMRAHNEKRALHGVPRVTLNNELNDKAQKYANKMAAKKQMQPDPNSEFGQNLRQDPNRIPSGKEAVEDWYAQAKNYDFRQPGYSDDTGAFTQVVWNGSKKLGVGAARGRDKDWYIVVFYSPAGNVEGEFKENVPIVKGENYRAAQAGGRTLGDTLRNYGFGEITDALELEASGP